MLIVASLIEREAKTETTGRRSPASSTTGSPSACRCRSTPRSTTARSPPASTLDDAVRPAAPDARPYNTYLNTGLPPTPIANPGRASIQAALNPAPNPSVGDPLCPALPEGTPCKYLYYVLADEDGNHAFAVTAEQHEANVAGRRRRRRSS